MLIARYHVSARTKLISSVNQPKNSLSPNVSFNLSFESSSNPDQITLTHNIQFIR